MSLRDPAPVRSPRAALLVAALGTVLSLIAFTMTLATIGPTGSDLGAGVSGRTWILSSMSIGLGAALLTAGTIADDVGRRRTFVVGLAVLVAGSLACVVTSSVVVFVAARIVQGVGSAAVIASCLGIIAHAFPAGPARARASGVWGASVGTGIAIGPVGEDSNAFVKNAAERSIARRRRSALQMRRNRRKLALPRGGRIH